MSLALRYRMRGAHHCSGLPVSEMTYTVSSGTLNSTIPYSTVNGLTQKLLITTFMKIYGTVGHNPATSRLDFE